MRSHGAAVQTLGLGSLRNVEVQHPRYVLKVLSGSSSAESRVEKWGITVSSDTTDQHPKNLVPHPKQDLPQAEMLGCVWLLCAVQDILEQLLLVLIAQAGCESEPKVRD